MRSPKWPDGSLVLCVCVCVCERETEVWTQGLHLEPLHWPYFCEGFFEMESRRTICLGWLWTVILLISASWVARITGMSHQCPVEPCSLRTAHSHKNSCHKTRTNSFWEQPTHFPLGHTSERPSLNIRTPRTRLSTHSDHIQTKARVCLLASQEQFCFSHFLLWGTIQSRNLNREYLIGKMLDL
jgi:hypothetical protein